MFGSQISSPPTTRRVRPAPKQKTPPDPHARGANRGEECRAELNHGETIETSIFATYEGQGGWTQGRLVLTSGQRLLFAGRAAMQRVTRSYALSMISALDTEKSATTSHLFIVTNAANDKFMVGDLEGAQRFAAAVQARIAALHSPAVAAPSAADELAKFAALHAQGILSDEEWAATKARLLGI